MATDALWFRIALIVLRILACAVSVSGPAMINLCGFSDIKTVSGDLKRPLVQREQRLGYHPCINARFSLYFYVPGLY
jgi:hypothetical protein